MSKRFVKCLIFVLCVSLVAGPTLSLAGPPLKEARSDYLPLRPAPSSRAKRVNRSIHGRPQAEPGAVGQTTTVLADGRLLLLGGETEDGPSATAFIRDVRTGEVTVLPTIMYEARAWHSATMLPNGRVLVLGGIGPNGQILGSAELFNPEEQSFELLSPSRFSARAHHTATLLTNGTVLIAGGVSDKGQGTTRAELWDFRSGTLTKINAPQTATRKNHRATLLPDGNVLFEGGVQADGKESVTAELYNSETGEFLITTLSSADSDPAAAPFVSASSPRDGATDVSSDDFISLRFSKALLAETINDQSIRLSGSEGQITAKVVAAESGRLAFIKPNGSLLSDATYTLSILGAKTNSTEIIGTSITFTTKGQKPSDKETPSNPIANQPDWTPDSSALRGNWKTNREKSSWQDLAPLQAAPDETALAGQALTLTGQPLANVTLRIGEKTAQTDTSGRFLLRAIGKGHQVLVIDGRTANERGRVYGTFRVGIEVKEKITNVLPFRIWMPRLDMGHAVSVTSPTTGETIITNPLIPGLELRLPQGTSIRDLDGNLVTQISITPVPTDRPPFPLPPGFNVPVFASIQPGGARVIPPRAQLIYPNYTNERAGARIDFWNYDPEEKGWYIYGQGTVTANGKQIIPDPGVVIYEFTGIMISSGGSPPWWWPFGDSEDGDPVDLASGLFVLEKTDLVLPDTIPLSLTRVYRPADNVSRAFGIGSSHPYDMFLWSVNNYQQTDLILPNGGRVHYVRISPGTGWGDAIYEHTETTGPFYKSRISWNGGGWDLKLRDGTVYVFPEYAPLRYIRDRYGNQITINRSGSNITEITSPHGRWIQFTYDSNRITQARDNIGRAVNYAYDTSGRLWRVTDPNGGITEYTYDTSNRMRTIKDARGIVYLTNEYDANGRVFRQTQADNSIYQFAYTLDTNGKVTQTDVTDPRGFVRRVTFNSSGYVLTDTHALGRPEQQIVTLERQSGTNLPLSVFDPLNHRTNYVYDSMGNVTSVTDLAGTPDAVTMTFTYDPLYNQPLSATDALNHTTNFNYDGLGKLIGITNPLNDQVTFEYNTAGQMISMSNAMGHTTRWAYDGADLVSLTNPLGHVSRRFVDAIGRPISTTDALGHVNKFTYDVLNQIVQATNAAGGNTSFTYDPNGNLLTVTDPRNSVTTYTYDSMDRIATRKDPLLREESYIYDGNGNLTQFTDRNGQITSYSYDALDRLTLVTYADTSTTSFVYDAANRLTQAVDSISGSISLTYDNLDRTTSETTAYGSASYTYDDADRRTSMTVTGQPTINYSHDNANRLTGITQGQTSVSYSYDAAGRRSSITLPNGVVGDYGYDVGSNLTSLTYRQGANVIGNLTYEYNALRARTKVGGSLARTISTPALPLGTYNAANQLVQRGTTTYTYDNNGNLLNDGTNTYSWDARSQLTSISGGASASFQYDSFGRRTGKTVNNQSSQYSYDGSRVVQELSGGVPTANMLLGLGVDERHSCSCSGSNSSFLTDVLGSALALTDSSGAVQTQYTYDAFGNTASSGAASSNSSQYTGRENDGTGLYYYRARYYSPALQRFISQDPIGFAGDDTNLYAYVGNNPINLSDPFGTNPLAAAGAVCLEGAIIGAATDALINALTGRKITLSGLGRSALMGCGMALIGLGLGRALGAAMRMFGRGAGGGTNVVYQSVNAAGEVNYVGITNNLGRRAAEHLASPRALQINPIPGLNNLSRADARAVEQVLIETHGLARNSGTLLNRINSIARTNPAYADAIRRGTEILRRAGYPGF